MVPTTPFYTISSCFHASRAACASMPIKWTCNSTEQCEGQSTSPLEGWDKRQQAEVDIRQWYMTVWITLHRDSMTPTSFNHWKRHVRALGKGSVWYFSFTFVKPQGHFMYLVYTVWSCALYCMQYCAHPQSGRTLFLNFSPCPCGPCNLLYHGRIRYLLS